MKQLALDISLPAYANFSTFIPNGNESLIGALNAIASKPTCGETLFLSGLKGAGKTHLLHACCHVVNQQYTSIYIDLEQEDLTPDSLQGWDHVALICLDNLEAVIASLDWQEALFDLFNQRLARDDGTHASLIVSSQYTPLELTVTLKDLSSRLSSGLVYQVNALDKEFLRQAIAVHAEQRGFDISEDVSDYLLKRLPRDLISLIRTLETFDKASLEAKRKITIPFVKSILD